MIVCFPNKDMKESTFSLNFRWKELPPVVPVPGFVHNDAGVLKEGEMHEHEHTGAYYMVSNVNLGLKPADAQKGQAHAEMATQPKLFTPAELLGSERGPGIAAEFDNWEHPEIQRNPDVGPARLLRRGRPAVPLAPRLRGP